MSQRMAVLAAKQAIRSRLQPRLAAAFEANDDKASVENTAAYRLWSAMNRASQDRMWSVLAAQIDEDYERIAAAAKATTQSAGAVAGVDEKCDVPAYQSGHAIHGQPGGYMLDRGDDDLAAGILYEAGGNLYALGQGIGKRDSKGERLIAFIRERFPALEPRKILELGCSAGGQSCDYPAAFPDAECHAIDLSPGMLRYAHARAAALGERVMFRQADAADTGFDDQTFDLIVSHNLFHEVATDHVPRIMRECRRLLRPGGVCVHQDVPIQTRRLDAFTRFLSEWQRDHNDEPFWLDFANADLPEILAAAGFDAANVAEEYLQAIDGPIPWYVVTAVR